MSVQSDLVGFLSTQDKPWQLVKHWEDVPEKKRGTGPWWCEVKYDGVFCAVVLAGDMPVAISRTGKPFWREVNDKILALCPPDMSSEQVLICELINPKVSLEELSGLVNPNRVNSWTATQADLMSSVDIVVHDLLTFDEVYAGYSKRRQHDRRIEAWKLHPRVHKASGIKCDTWEDVELFALAAIEKGLEGIVIKQPNLDYEAGHKGYRVMKWVRDLHVDLKCLAVETGKGKRTGQIARLQFKYKGKLFWADLGKGWTDEKRIELTHNWKNTWASNPLGKIFHLSALQESSKGVLRLPKVNELRIDKFVEDVT
jgi:ATP-dependent DNA ligase